METRAIVAIALSIIVLLLYQYFLLPTPQKPPEEQTPAQQEQAPPSTPAETGRPVAVEEPQEASSPETALPAVKVTPLPQEALQRVTVDTGVARVVLLNQGGSIEQVLLTRYLTKEGEPIDLLAEKEGEGFPPYLIFSDPQLTQAINNAPFATTTTGVVQLSATQPTGEVRFQYRHPSGLQVSKTYRFRYDTYGIEFSLEIEAPPASGLSTYQLFWGPGLYDESNGQSRYTTTGPIGSVAGKLVFDKPKEPDTVQTISGQIQWIALQSKYFVAALLPSSSQPPARALVALNQFKEYAVGLESPLTTAQSRALYTLYLGPKEGKRLSRYGPSEAPLSKILDHDYGWFAFLAWPLLKVLNFFYLYTHNYGVAIILLTFLIKVLFFPLTHKSYQSMRDMQKLQPQIQALQERYKNDKQKLNQEMMRLYRENRVNPLGGCLPMVLQIPIFFALYRVLYVAIELRHAPFFLWITDLSDKDPYYVSPILMGISMVIQQKMTPTTGDPKQAKLMLLMPVVFTVLFLNFPVGLVIYWLVNNLLTIGQQYWIQKKVKAPSATVKA